MARKLLKRWIPDPSKVKKIRGLQFLGKLLHDPNLFHLNRHSVSVAVFVGVFVAFLPIPGQMPLAALLALVFRCNLPIAIVGCWITNPLTMVPVFYTTYELGRWILHTPPVKFSIELSWTWLTEEFHRMWQPLMFGSVLAGLVLGFLGYLAMQAFWYWYVMRNWERRRAARHSRQQNN